MSNGDSLLTLETTLKQLDDFCRTAENQLRPLMAQLEECRESQEGRSERLNYLLDRTQGKGFSLMANVMEMKRRVRALRDQLQEETIQID